MSTDGRTLNAWLPLSFCFLFSVFEALLGPGWASCFAVRLNQSLMSVSVHSCLSYDTGQPEQGPECRRPWFGRFLPILASDCSNLRGSYTLLYPHPCFTFNSILLVFRTHSEPSILLHRLVSLTMPPMLFSRVLQCFVFPHRFSSEICRA